MDHSQRKTVLITGLNSQDGSYLAEFLLNKGYHVVGTVRGKNPLWPYGFEPNQPNLDIELFDLGYPDSIRNIFQKYTHIDEVYNLAAQSHVGESFKHPEETYQVTGVGACRLMDLYFQSFSDGKFYQASTSELFGNRTSLLEQFSPESPYAVAKMMAHYNAKRHANMGHYAVSGILYNHESPRRHESFVTQKICKHVAQAKHWTTKGFLSEREHKPILYLGNIDSARDWGYAPEYVEIMWRLMCPNNLVSPISVVIGTGKSYTVKEFAQKAFAYVGLEWQEFTVIDNSLLRPNDVHFLQADPTEANNLLGRPLSSLDRLIPIMVEHQCTIQGVKLPQSIEK